VAKPPTIDPRAVGYVRLSKDEGHGNGGLGLDAQRTAIKRVVAERGWRLVDIIEDIGWSGRSLRRPGIEHVLAMLEEGAAGILVVAKLDRLTRRKIDLESLIEKMGRTRRVRAGREWRTLPAWQLVPVDMPSFDTTTPAGRLAASVIASAAQYEREMIARRTSDALAVKKARGERVGGQTLVSDEVRARVVRLRKRGYGWLKIAKTLKAEGHKPGRGGKQFYASTAKRIWQSAQYIAEREKIARKRKEDKDKS
jgi:DNA invertase Pin-like site-specific DNA recombinase